MEGNAGLPATQIIVAGGDERLDELEGRLSLQEVRSQALVEKAVRVKADLVEALNFTHGTWKDEQNARALLQEHIRTITEAVRNLNHDIVASKRAVHNRNTSAFANDSSVKHLEQLHSGVLSEMRGKLTRADGAVAQLSTEIRHVHDALKGAHVTQGESVSRLADRIQALERESGLMDSTLENQKSDTALKLRAAEGESNKLLSLLDTRSRFIVGDLHKTLANLQAASETERQKMEQRLTSHLDRGLTARDSRLAKLESVAQDGVEQLKARTDGFETEIRALRDGVSRLESHMLALQQRVQMQPMTTVSTQSVAVTTPVFDHSGIRDVERDLKERIDRLDRRFDRNVEHMKRQCREGFTTVHQTVDTLNLTFVGKVTLLEEQVHKELASLRTAVVYI